MIEELQTKVTVSITSLTDTFTDGRKAGRVIGTRTLEGFLRGGVDKENIIGIDNGALRIQPLVKPGWGRAGIAYGPFRRENGLAFHAMVLNGHNISRTEMLPDGFKMRLWRWAIGSETEKVSWRILRWVKHGQKRQMRRRLMQWIMSGTGLFHLPSIDENLSVGWFPTEAPSQPLHEGCSLIMHAIVPEGGELWARVGASCAPTLRGLQNVPMYYTVVLRETGAAYYASPVAGALDVRESPRMRLLAIDAFNTDDNLYAGIHQSVLGEIGFRVDTRVYGVQVAKLPEWSAWYGSAHGADSLTGQSSLLSSPAETGGHWQVYEGEFLRTTRGAVGIVDCNTAVLKLDSPSGLIHAVIDCDDKRVESVALIWRALDENNFWCFEVGSWHAQLSIVAEGHRVRHPSVRDRYLPPNTASSIQVSDDGEAIRIYVNGSLVYGTTFYDTRMQAGTGTGIQIASRESSVAVRSFEAHPREIRIPQVVEFAGPQLVQGNTVIVVDDFKGPAGDLEGHRTAQGGLAWSRGIGQGVIELTGHGSAKVRGSAQQPCPGRTAYMVEWPSHGFADLEVSITPPGKQRGAKERGRAGLIFWQDADNYIILSAFVEHWPAMSIAAFFQISGFEELYDAVWSNVGRRMHWGESHDFRVAFDGQHFVAYINGEPVLYRSMTDIYPGYGGLRINRTGIVANWEWGNDTGSTFENLVGRDRQ